MGCLHTAVAPTDEQRRIALQRLEQQKTLSSSMSPYSHSRTDAVFARCGEPQNSTPFGAHSSVQSAQFFKLDLPNMSDSCFDKPAPRQLALALELSALSDMEHTLEDIVEVLPE